MNCPTCNHEIPANAKFCNECGAKVENQGKTCPNEKCKRSGLPAEAKFCPECGTAFNKSFASYTEIVDGLCIDMIAVKGISYREDDHIVTIDDFYISKKPVSLELYGKVMGNVPVASWEIYSTVEPLFKYYDTLKFCNKLSELTSRSSVYKFSYPGFTWSNELNGFMLPTIGQIEYVMEKGEALGLSEICKESWKEWSLNWAHYYNRQEKFENPNGDILKFRIVLNR